MENIEILENTRTTKVKPFEFNPWLSILTKPRETIFYITDTNPTKYVILLAVIGGIIDATFKAMNKYSNPYQAIWNILISGTITGFISLYVLGFLIQVSGKLLKGKGTEVTIRAACAWSILPQIVAMPLFIITIFLFTYKIAWPLITCQVLVTACWLIVMSKTIAQVQNFKSAWMGLLNIVLAILIPALLILILFSIMHHNSTDPSSITINFYNYTITF